MNPKFIIIPGLLLVIISCVNGHARLMQPASRASAYRTMPDKFPFVKQDDTRFCHQNDANGIFFNGNATCGICGPVYGGDVTNSARLTVPHLGYDNYHFSFEKGGPYYTGRIVETYKKGQTIEALIEVKQNKLKPFDL